MYQPFRFYTLDLLHKADGIVLKDQGTKQPGAACGASATASSDRQSGPSA